MAFKSSGMITSSLAQQRIKESLGGFPPEIQAAYLNFAEKADPASLDVVVLGVLHFYMAKKPSTPLATLPGTTRLIDDLGCDSLTMMDTVFMIESLFDLKIDDAELARIATLDDLRANLRRHMAGTAKSA